MNDTPFSIAESLHIGTVDYVSPDEIKVLLDIEAPDDVALNAGDIRPFPRVNGYVLLPVDDGYLVGQIEWLSIERAAFPKRDGVRDFGLVDLPYPLRRMSLIPIGMLRQRSTAEEHYVFERGAHALPSVGAAVLLPTTKQLKSIIESGERRYVRIGTSPLADNAEVCIDPDRLFGRHLAVLGNTGSGKSCSVAGLIRWSLKAAAKKREDGSKPNARFIILDPNGEYLRAFSDPELKANIFKIDPGKDEKPLKVPLWFWNSAEWASFTKASPKAQQPTLIHALRVARSGKIEITEGHSHQLRQFLRTIITTLQIEIRSGSPWGSFPRPKNFYGKIEKWRISLEQDLNSLQGTEYNGLLEFVTLLQESHTKRSATQYPDYDFSREEANALLGSAQNAHRAFGGSESDFELLDADIPLPFTGDDFVRIIEAVAEMLNVSEHTETLLIRIRSLLKDSRINQIMGNQYSEELANWLTHFIGDGKGSEDCISVIDLSLVPQEVTHIIVAVIARMIFESLQRYRKLNHTILPTVLVMEEAHTFIKQYKDDVESYDAASVCCQVFERIAREGRKFGLSLVLSSQRPSELSPTVLSQCNTFLLHRISNDRDQELVRQLVPDNLRGLLRELPTLPSQNAILLGWASELPILVKIDDLPKTQQPHSDDPDFWSVWTGEDEKGNKVDRFVDWKSIADDWQGKTKNSQSVGPDESSL